MSGSQLVGVLSVYSTIADAFTDDHRRLIEVVARQVSETIRQVREADLAKTATQRGCTRPTTPGTGRELCRRRD